MNYWAFRIGKDHIKYFDDELKKGKLRQGWGGHDNQDLRLLDKPEFIDGGAGRNRKMFEEVKRGDIILVPRLPKWGRVAVVKATQDWKEGYQYDEGLKCEWGLDFRHVFPAKLECDFGRNDSHVGSGIRSTLRTPLRFWNIKDYSDEVEAILNTPKSKIKEDQKKTDRLQDAIGMAFDRQEFKTKFCASINKQFGAADWEPVLVNVLQQLEPHFVVERVGGITEKQHGTDILMTLKPALGLKDQPVYGIAIQVKDYEGVVGDDVIKQINKADYWKKERNLEFVKKVVIVTNASKEKNESLLKKAEDNKVTIIFMEELNELLTLYGEQQIVKFNED